GRPARRLRLGGGVVGRARRRSRGRRARQVGHAIDQPWRGGGDARARRRSGRRGEARDRRRSPSDRRARRRAGRGCGPDAARNRPLRPVLRGQAVPCIRTTARPSRHHCGPRMGGGRANGERAGGADPL
ncbi:MAG: hypothetical protein AVDCRST_MAG91-3520, partial [uncultured Sphingomonadaceae bacterium]